MPKVEHSHMAGHNACPHPDCVAIEDRRADKVKALAIARKIQARPMDGGHYFLDTTDVHELARLTLKLLQD